MYPVTSFATHPALEGTLNWRSRPYAMVVRLSWRRLRNLKTLALGLRSEKANSSNPSGQRGRVNGQKPPYGRLKVQQWTKTAVSNSA